jgi:hypothetical protein
MAVVNTGMSKSDMKKLLIRSKEEPVNCAIGVGEDAAYGLLLMSKTKGPKVLEKTLMLEFPKVKNTRFGTAFVDVEDNPKLVKLSLNRNVSGMSKKLIKTLKGTGFSKVIIVFEDGSEAESHEEADEEALDGVGAAPAAPAEAAAAAPAAPPPPPGPPPVSKSPEEVAAQTAALAKVLAGLAPLIPKAAGDDAARKATLLKLATDANVNIKTGNLKAAGGFLAQLKAELQGAAAPAPQPATLQTLTASRQQWTGTQEKVRAEVDKLRAALTQTYKNQPFANEIESRFQAKVAPVVSRFDDRLLDVLDDMMNTKDAGERSKLVTDAHGLIKEYLSFAMSDPLIGDLDTNPFVPLAIRSTVTSTLAQLEKTTH